MLELTKVDLTTLSDAEPRVLAAFVTRLRHEGPKDRRAAACVNKIGHEADLRGKLC